MKLMRFNGAELEDIHVPDLPMYAKDGIYVCCMNHNHGEGCRFHIWVFANPSAAVPSHQKILATMKKEVPHFNGQGQHG